MSAHHIIARGQKNQFSPLQIIEADTETPWLDTPLFIIFILKLADQFGSFLCRHNTTVNLHNGFLECIRFN